MWNFETFPIYLMLEMPECVVNILLFYDVACIAHGLLCSKLSSFCIRHFSCVMFSG